MDGKKSYYRCLLFFTVLATAFSVSSPHFLAFSNLEDVLAASAVIGLLSLGSTFVIGSGGIDLSVGSVMALSGTAAAVAVKSGVNSSALALAIAVVVGGAVGTMTATLINITKAPSFIVTLGILSVARGMAFIISDGLPVYGLPLEITSIGQSRVSGVSVPALLFLACSLLCSFILHKTRFGAHTLLYGDNPHAAQSLGIAADALRLKIYTLSGLLSGLAGFVFMARTNAGDPAAGLNYELTAITAVILGGATLKGGHATIAGTVLGVACLGVLQNGLNLLGIRTYYQLLVIGAVLILAALAQKGNSRFE